MRSIVSVALVVGIASCAPPPPVRFGGELVERPVEEYDKTRAAWTRHIHVTRDYDTAVDADLLLLSPEMRGALITRVADMRELTAAQHEELAKSERADLEKFVDVIVNMKTARWEWNDLTAPRSVWTLTLVDDKGDQASPSEIIQNPVKPEVMDALFAPVGSGTTAHDNLMPFVRSYRVRFARVPPTLLGPDTRWVEVRMAGPLGAEKARWDSR